MKATLLKLTLLAAGALVSGFAQSARQVMTNQTVQAMVNGGVPLATITQAIKSAARIQLFMNDREFEQLRSAGASVSDANEIMKAIHDREYNGVSHWPASTTPAAAPLAPATVSVPIPASARPAPAPVATASMPVQAQHAPEQFNPPPTPPAGQYAYVTPVAPVAPARAAAPLAPTTVSVPIPAAVRPASAPVAMAAIPVQAQPAPEQFNPPPTPPAGQYGYVASVAAVAPTRTSAPVTPAQAVTPGPPMPGAAASFTSTGTIPAGSKIFVDDSNGFDNFILAAFRVKHLAVVLVASPDNADYVLSSSLFHSSGYIATQRIATTTGMSEGAFKLTSTHTGQIVWAYTATKALFGGTKQSVAESCARHLKGIVK